MTPSEDRVLNNCPFCGGAADLAVIVIPAGRLAEEQPQRRYYVKCSLCRAATVGMRDRGKAIAAWNRRADPLVEELRGVKCPIHDRDITICPEGCAEGYAAGVEIAKRSSKAFREALALPVGGGSACADSAGEEPSGSFAGEAQCQSERRLRDALLRVKRTLTVPAAECVPAIRDAWDIIDVALNPEPEERS